MHNNDGDVNDDGVNALHAIVNEERLEVQSCVSLFIVVHYCCCSCWLHMKMCMCVWTSSCQSVNLSPCPWSLPDPFFISHEFSLLVACFITTLYSCHSPTMSSSSVSSTTPTSTMSSSAMSVSSSRTMLRKSLGLWLPVTSAGCPKKRLSFSSP